jgi:hypothetical protein
MSNSSQPQIDVGLSPVERREVLALARGIPTALTFALAATACWYVAWVAFSIDVSAWAGLAVFSSACVLGYGLARLLLHRSVADEMRRRNALVKFAHEYKKQRESNQLKGE